MSTDPANQNQPESAQDSIETDAPQSPRAFSSGTGAVCQFTGIIYMALAAIYWFASGRLHLPVKDRIDVITEYLKPENIVFTMATLNVLAGFAGGFALAAFGVGLQGEQRSSGVGAMVTAILLVIANIIGAVGCVAFGPAWFAAFVFTVAAAANTILFLLAGYSSAILKQHPPPPDQSIVDDAWIEEYHRKRRERRGF